MGPEGSIAGAPGEAPAARRAALPRRGRAPLGRVPSARDPGQGMTISKVGVVGCGLMGSGIAQVVAQAGYATTVVEADQALLERGLTGLRRNLDGLVDKGRLAPDQRDAARERITGTVRLDDLAGVDLVIEAITENPVVKKETFAQLDRICPSHALLASNTSSCTITELAAATKRPAQVLGLHFFNPAPVMKLVEVIRTILTGDPAFKVAWGFVQSLGKTPVAAQDTTGFVVNRLLVPYLLEAVRLLESGVASKEDIDQAMKLGCGYPMGPFTLLDLVGPRHDALRGGGHVPGVPRGPIRPPAAPAAHGDGRTPGQEEREGVLRPSGPIGDAMTRDGSRPVPQHHEARAPGIRAALVLAVRRGNRPVPRRPVGAPPPRRIGSTVTATRTRATGSRFRSHPGGTSSPRR